MQSDRLTQTKQKKPHKNDKKNRKNETENLK